MPETPHTEVAIRHRVGSLALDAPFATAAPWTVLFGPSGSGKSTILRAIAGLARPDAGHVRLLGKVVFDAAARIDVPAHRRSMRWAGQRTALFPRMTVRENLWRGLASSPGRTAPSRTAPSRTAPEELDRAIEHFRLEELAPRLPRALSGGQQQRVAVIRAAVGARGGVLLLDEPFTGLDAGMRAELIAQLRSWLGSTPVLSVTHDVGEAFLLDAEIVRIADGHVVAQGAAVSVLAAERDGLLATLEPGARASSSSE